MAKTARKTSTAPKARKAAPKAAAKAPARRSAPLKAAPVKTEAPKAPATVTPINSTAAQALKALKGRKSVTAAVAALPEADRKAAASKAPSKAAASTGPRRTAATQAMFDSAAKGKIPAAPDFSKPTHASYRKKLADMVAMVKAGDLKGLKANTLVKTGSSSAQLVRYRDCAIAALTAKAARK